MSAAYDQTVRYENAVDALPVAFCEAPKTFVAVVFNEARDPAPCFHCRSAAPLVARPPFVPVHVAACAAIVKFHGRLDLTVAVGPASSWNPASNAVSVGFVSVVAAGFSVRLLTLGALAGAALFPEEVLAVPHLPRARVLRAAGGGQGPGRGK